MNLHKLFEINLSRIVLPVVAGILISASIYYFVTLIYPVFTGKQRQIKPDTKGVICGGWNTGGEIICECNGKLTKTECPNDVICDVRGYYCLGTCGKCCFKGVAENSKYPKCEAEENTKLGDAGTKSECLAKGGVWQKWGLRGEEYCQTPAADGGKSCNDGSECIIGSCISRSGQIPGRCQTYQNEFGCMSFVENGQVSGAICID